MIFLIFSQIVILCVNSSNMYVVLDHIWVPEAKYNIGYYEKESFIEHYKI